MSVVARSILGTLVVALLAVAAPARAQAAHGCKGDVEKFCKGIPEGGGRIAACLKSHEAELSPSCKEDVAAAKGRMKGLAEACKPDAERFCKGVQPGQGRVLSCLKSHEADLAPACKAEMSR